MIAPALGRVGGVREGSREQQWRCGVLDASAFQNLSDVSSSESMCGEVGSYGKFWSVITSAHYPNLRSAGVPDSRVKSLY